MRLRTALKICKRLHGHPKRKHGKWLWKPGIPWRRERCWEATAVGQQADERGDRRFWFVPTPGELDEREELMEMVLSGALEAALGEPIIDPVEVDEDEPTELEKRRPPV